MSIEITSRHMHATDDASDYARSRAERLAEKFPRVEHVHVILDHQKHLTIAEVVVQAKNHLRVEADASTDNLMASIDAAMDKATRQLRKQRDKIQEHKGAGKRLAQPAEEDVL